MSCSLSDVLLFFFLRVFIFIQKNTCISMMGVMKQKHFITSTRFTMSLTDIQYKTCVVCKISLFYHFIIFYIYIILFVFIIYLFFIFFVYVPAILGWTRPGKTGG